MCRESSIIILNVYKKWNPNFSPCICIGLSDTLAMWKCVVLLLQNEDLVVRDAAAEVLQVAQIEKKSTSGSGMLTYLHC